MWGREDFFSIMAGVMSEFTKWQSAEDAVFTLAPFYMEIRNMAFLFSSGTRIIEVNSARGPRWYMIPLFFWCEQGLSWTSRDSTLKLSWWGHTWVCPLWSNLSYPSIKRPEYILSFSFLQKWSEFLQCQLSPVVFLSLQSDTVQI